LPRAEVSAEQQILLQNITLRKSESTVAFASGAPYGALQGFAPEDEKPCRCPGIIRVKARREGGEAMRDQPDLPQTEPSLEPMTEPGFEPGLGAEANARSGRTMRRGFLAGLGALGFLSFLPRRALALVPSRSLTLHSPELGEKVRATYYENGRYDRLALTEIRRLFRDKHNDTEIDIDPQLVDLLWTIQRQLSPNQPLDVICGYRSPETNAYLRRHSSGVAANSFHMYGKAADLRIPGCGVSTLNRFAINLEAGGVGYYPRSNFVHVDTGPVRRWGQNGRLISDRASKTSAKAASRKKRVVGSTGKSRRVSLKTKG
jgi:uncharacterized protein YcbK (DUF882 family)